MGLKALDLRQDSPMKTRKNVIFIRQSWGEMRFGLIMKLSGYREIIIYEMVKNNRQREIILEREKRWRKEKTSFWSRFWAWVSSSKSEDNFCRTVDIEVLALLLACKVGKLPSFYFGLFLVAPLKSRVVWDPLIEHIEIAC